VSFGDIIGYVISAIENVVNFVVSIILDLVKAINAVFGFIWNTLKAFAGAIVDVFQRAGKFFVNLWTAYLKPAVRGLINLYGKIRARLYAIFGPVLKIIARVRAWFYHYIYPWIKRAEDLLSRIRVVLALFRLLGAKWAAKLDADIARIQGYLTTALQGIVRALNTATTWITLAVDPAGVIRGGFFRNTLFSSVLDVRKAATFADDRALTASEAQNTADDRAMANGGAAVLTRKADGSITYSEASTRINNAGNAAWDVYGPPAVTH